MECWNIGKLGNSIIPTIKLSKIINKMNIGIIDYGAGNIASVKNAFDNIGVSSFCSNNPNELSVADKIVFPGVGHAKPAMEKLKEFNLDKFIANTNKPLLGICLGMQLMGKLSDEGNTECIGVFDFEVKRFDQSLKIPHMGWNKFYQFNNPLFKGISSGEWAYFVHSYYVSNSSECICNTNYGVDFCSGVNKSNFWGVQFHPEKSGEKGLQILKNFIEL